MAVLYIHYVYTRGMSTTKSKQSISIRVDPEVLEWFRGNAPRGYQTLMHAVLKQHVQQQVKLSERIAGRAQELFRKFYAQCFWHMNPSLEITPSNTQIVVDGLRKYGGREGLQLAEELCQ